MNRFPVLLYAGDLIAILLFAVIGRQSHSLPTGAGALGETFTTAAPFMVGWLIAAPWFGAFRPAAWQNWRAATTVVLKAFVPAFLAGVLFRWLFEGRLSALVFYLVSAVAILALLLAWRLIHTLVLAPRQQR